MGRATQEREEQKRAKTGLGRIDGCTHSPTMSTTTTYTTGPVSCYIDANPLETYTGGINMYENAGPTNHAIALLGYGEEDGTKYWVSKE